MHWAEEIRLERERERARGRGLEDWAGWGGEGRKERVGLPGWVGLQGRFEFLLLSYFFCFSNSNTTQNYLNPNSDLNSNPTTLNQIKLCTSMNAQHVDLKILITYERKLI